MLGGPFGLNSMRTALLAPTTSSAAAKSFGLLVMARPMVMPPAEVPSPARCAGDVYLWATSHSPQAMKSCQVCGLVAIIPAWCHASPYQPPPRAWQTAKTPPRSSHATRVALNDGESVIP